MPAVKMSDPTNSYEEMDEHQRRFALHETVSFVWRQWKFIGATAAITTLIGVTLLIREIPLYTATSQVLLNVQPEKTAATERLVNEIDLDMAMIENQMAIIR